MLRSDLELTEGSIISQMISIWTASSHTTSLLLTWMFYFLGKHKDVQQKLREEIRTVVGDEELTPKHLQDLCYTRKCIDETLRCGVVATWGARISENDEKIGDYVVPKNTPILIPIGIQCQDQDIFPDPLTFNPDNFDSEKMKKRRKDFGKFVYSPLGFAGKRVCPGQRDTMVKAQMILVNSSEILN
eukprot:TRINITY_DN8766_c0_g1_i1.p1 TRINITY_DN8766_c0_g1~~TRINITY_DN8766_c0_g1_i1.p1  ORF type:complete len:187 (+),score=31.58 TRINITY_DN8766_c0_g1_i1:122-682(+)